MINLILWDYLACAPDYVLSNIEKSKRTFDETILFTDQAFKAAWEEAKLFFGVLSAEYPESPTVVSDYIRLMLLIKTPKLSYSDTDVKWMVKPTHVDEPTTGNGSLAILYSGNGITDYSKLLAYAQKTKMQKNVPSYLIFPFKPKYAAGCFEIHKPFPHPPGGYFPGHYPQ